MRRTVHAVVLDAPVVERAIAGVLIFWRRSAVAIGRKGAKQAILFKDRARGGGLLRRRRAGEAEQQHERQEERPARTQRHYSHLWNHAVGLPRRAPLSFKSKWRPAAICGFPLVTHSMTRL